MRNPIFYAGVAKHLGITKTNQNRTFGMLGVMADNADRTHLVRHAIAWAIARAGHAVNFFVDDSCSAWERIIHYPTCYPGFE